MAGRAVLITGGTNGIGRAAAERFASDGDDVVVWGKNQERIDTINGAGNPHLRAERVDVSNDAEVQAACERYTAQFPTVDVLVNAAGATGQVLTTTEHGEAIKTWREVLA